MREAMGDIVPGPPGQKRATLKKKSSNRMLKQDLQKITGCPEKLAQGAPMSYDGPA